MTKVAIVTPGTLNDADWTDGAREAFGGLVKTLRLRSVTAEGAGPGDIVSVLERLSSGGAQLVIAHDSSYATAAPRVAAKTKVPELVWGNRSAMRPGLVGDVEVDAADGGYVAGVISGHSSYYRTYAIVIASDGTRWDATNWNRMAGGFIAGVRSIDPHARIPVRWIDPAHSEVRYAQRLAEGMLARGTETIFTLGGRSAIGVLRAINLTTGEQEYAGVIGAKTRYWNNDVVTSVLYEFAPTFRSAVADLKAGTFGRRVYTLGLTNGGLRFLRTGRTPSDAYDAGMAAGMQVARGKLRVPLTSTQAEVLALPGARGRP